MAATAMGVAVWRLHAAAAQPPRLTKVALHPPKSVEVEFADVSSFQLPAEFLRMYSPAADSKIISVAGEKVIFGRRHVGIMSAESVGNYGVRLLFDDLHKTGIFTWDYLHHLDSNKFGLMRNYIRTLRKHGLSRDSGSSEKEMMKPKALCNFLLPYNENSKRCFRQYCCDTTKTQRNAVARIEFSDMNTEFRKLNM